jgi:hypothetical protein
MNDKYKQRASTRNQQNNKKPNVFSVNRNDYFDDTTTLDLELKQTRADAQLIDLDECKQDTASQIYSNDDFDGSLKAKNRNSSAVTMINTSTNNLLNLNEEADMYAHNSPYHPNTHKVLKTSHSIDSSTMWHCHVPGSDDVNAKALRNNTARIKLILVTALCVFFMVAEIVGGVLAGSLAIQTDAAHMATDLAGFLLSLFAIYMSNKESTKRMSFGFYRTEILGALASTLMIWILTGILVYLAVDRVINNDYKIEPKFMVITAACGVFFNVLMAIVLHSNITGFNVSSLAAVQARYSNRFKSTLFQRYPIMATRMPTDTGMDTHTKTDMATRTHIPTPIQMRRLIPVKNV